MGQTAHNGAGEKRHYVAIYKPSPTPTRNADGQVIETPALVGNCYAEVESVGGMERVLGQERVADVLYRLKVWNTPLTRSIDATMWIVMSSGARLDITRAYDPDMRQIEVWLDCKQRPVGP